LQKEENWGSMKSPKAGRHKAIQFLYKIREKSRKVNGKKENKDERKGQNYTSRCGP
jgi:hypothetical protein